MKKRNIPCDPGRGRSENITAVKGGADRLPEIVICRNLVDNGVRLSLQDIGQDPVVRPHEKLISRRDGNRFTRTPDSGIHHGQVDSVRREVRVSLAEREGGRADILRGNRVRDVHEVEIRVDSQHHPLHCRDEMVLQAEVREQGNNAR